MVSKISSLRLAATSHDYWDGVEWAGEEQAAQAVVQLADQLAVEGALTPEQQRSAATEFL